MRSQEHYIQQTYNLGLNCANCLRLSLDLLSPTLKAGSGVYQIQTRSNELPTLSNYQYLKGLPKELPFACHAGGRGFESRPDRLQIKASKDFYLSRLFLFAYFLHTILPLSSLFRIWYGQVDY